MSENGRSPGPILERQSILGSDYSLKVLFLKKKIFFLIWIKLTKNNFQLRGIQPPPVLLDSPSALLWSKCTSEAKSPSWWTIWSNSFFYINNFIILHSFCLKYSFCIFCIPDLWLMRHNDVYAIKIRTLIVKTKNYIEMLTMY